MDELTFDRDAEQCILGSILIDYKTLPSVEAQIRSKDYYVKAHQLIYKAMLRLYTSGHPIDMITLSESLKLSGQLDKVGGSAYLASLIDATPTTANVMQHAKIVRRKAEVRNG